jgi:hypothetical protein
MLSRVLAVATVMLVLPFFVSAEETPPPTEATVIANINISDATILSTLRVEGISGAGVLMLPLAYSVGMLLNAVLLIYLFRRRFGRFLSPIKDTLMHGSFAALIAGLVAYEFLEVLGLYLDLNTFWGIFMQGLVAWVAGILTWWLILELMGNEEIKEVRTALHRKFWKVGVVLPDKEEI